MLSKALPLLPEVVYHPHALVLLQVSMKHSSGLLNVCELLLELLRLTTAVKLAEEDRSTDPVANFYNIIRNNVCVRSLLNCPSRLEKHGAF